MGELAGAARRSRRSLKDPAIPEPGDPPEWSRAGRSQAILWVALIALATPWLLTYNTAPSPTFLNQAAAWAGWGLALLLLASRPRPASALQPNVVAATWPLLMVAAVLAIAAASAPWWSSLPTSLGLSGVLTFAGAAFVLLAGASFGTADRLPDAGRVLFVPLLIGSLASVPIAAIQVFDPESAGNFLIAGASFAERASGNVRQPNHLSSLALWGLVALVWLHETHAKRHAPLIARAW